MKCHQMFLIVCMATFGLAMICGCGPSAPKASEAFWKPIPHFKAPTLFEQVRIKLRKQGDPNVLGFTLNEEGRLHLIYRDVVYVEWRESKRPDGTIHRDVGGYLKSSLIPETIMEQIRNGETPPGIKIVDYDSGGIDVYEFLGIKRPN